MKIHTAYFTVLVLLLFFPLEQGRAQNAFTVKGTVYDNDSITPIAFVFAVNRNTDAGTMTDAFGHFEVVARAQDTLVFSYLGYEVKRVFLSTIKDSLQGNVRYLKVVLQKKVMTLQQVIISSHEFTKEEKKYYTDKVDEYNRLKSRGFESPITGLYMAFSHEGKSMKKLIQMYDELLYDEMLEKRLTDDKLRQLTENPTLDCQAFRNYCRLSEDFLRLASEYDLFDVVLKKYAEFKSGKKPYRSVK
jgi:hypothetical protein